MFIEAWHYVAVLCIAKARLTSAETKRLDETKVEINLEGYLWVEQIARAYSNVGGESAIQ